MVPVSSAFETYGAICPPVTVAGTVNTTMFHGVDARLSEWTPPTPNAPRIVPPNTWTSEARIAVVATMMWLVPMATRVGTPVRSWEMIPSSPLPKPASP